MKYTTLLTAFALTGAIASPVHKRHLHNKRAYVTDVEVVTKTVYVTLGQQAPTPAPVPDKPAAQQPAPEQGGPVEPPAAGPIVVTTTIVEDPERSPKPSPKPSPKLQPEPQPEPEREPEPKPDLPKKPADDDFQSLALYHHNIHRANHSAADLVWDNGLADAARQLAESCYYEHNTDYGEGGYGQNMGYGYNHIGKLLTNAMYNGEMMAFAGSYGAAQPANSDFSAWGHFTQMVWQKTEKVGCYTHTCQALTDPNHGKPIPNTPFTVCNYSPPGNWAGEYGTNVLKPLGHPMVVV